jgi:hypothetical protein
VTAGPPFQPAEGYPAILQSRLDERHPWVEVFSVALWGWSTRQERIAFERIARRYRPDQVIVGLEITAGRARRSRGARPDLGQGGAHGGRGPAARPARRYRWKAARAPGQLGQAAVAAAPALAQALSDDNGHVRREAAIALGRIGPAAEAVAAVPLACALEDPDPTIRVVAARALGRIRAARAAPALARHLEDDDEAVRRAARASLEAIRDGTR